MNKTNMVDKGYSQESHVINKKDIDLLTQSYKGYLHSGFSLVDAFKMSIHSVNIVKVSEREGG